jgi:tRNA (cmo5U34)-methyltransferase
MMKDDLFATPQDEVPDFVFDERVVDVFPDMIKRSVPGYESRLAMMGVVARQYAEKNGRVYDLGSSLGASTLAIHRQTRDLDLKHICIDNSAAMVKRSQAILSRHMPQADLEIICDDIQSQAITDASVAVMSFTLQFIDADERLAAMQKVYDGLKSGGALILSEKVAFADERQQSLQTNWHHAFKGANGYSELEISQKRASIENVMVPDTLSQHQSRLASAGFDESYCWYQAFNFASIVALKH